MSLRVVLAPEAETRLLRRPGRPYDQRVSATRHQPGPRTTSYGKRTVIAFAVSGQRLMVVGAFHGGRDYESALGLDD